MDSAQKIFETLKGLKRTGRSRKSSEERLLDYCTQVLGAIEHIHVDFKQKTHPANPSLEDDDKKNLAKAISGFANSSGGVLIWGIEDKTLLPKPITNVSQFVSSMLQLAAQVTDPVVHGIDFMRNNFFASPSQATLAVSNPPVVQTARNFDS